jgi:lipid II:glycine glycyltransferase (peptidoglycan interpeptide bridge formation enzyme)
MNNLLHWHVIQWAMAQGYQFYDLCGIDLPWIGEFKRSFGGEDREYFSLERLASPFVAALRRWYGRWGKHRWRRAAI